MELIDLSPVFEGTEVRAFSAPCVKALLLEGGSSLGRNKLDALVDRAKELGAKGLAWFKVTAGLDSTDAAAVDSPLDKFLGDAERAALIGTTGAKTGDLIMVVADDWHLVSTVLGALRLDLGRLPVTEGGRRFCWVTDFPLFDGIDDEGRPQAAHHPFTMPHPDDMELLATDPLKVRSQAYDLVLNGWELGSGSVRIHRADIQSRVFTALGISDEEAESRFGFLLGAFKYGAPPHAGFAFGIDRLVAIFAGEENIREVIAFPKTQSGADLMTGAPKAVSPRQLRDLHLKLPVKGS
jgi:aspartyl-tRNA synthetase